jgi:hypothetical protein
MKSRPNISLRVQIRNKKWCKKQNAVLIVIYATNFTCRVRKCQRRSGGTERADFAAMTSQSATASTAVASLCLRTRDVRYLYGTVQV